MSYSILTLALLGVLAGCASGPNVAVMHAPGSYVLDTANPTRTYTYNYTVSSLGVVFKF